MILRQTEQSVIIHGGCLQIFNQGLLITGPSGIGKSELQLELLDRGHYWVGDDVTKVERIQQQLIAQCHSPPHLHQVAIKNLGIIDLSHLYSEQRFLSQTRLNAWIHLADSNSNAYSSLEEVDLLGIALPQLTLYQSDKRPSALIVELFIKHHF